MIPPPPPLVKHLRGTSGERCLPIHQPPAPAPSPQAPRQGETPKRKRVATVKLGGRGRSPAEAATRELGPVLGIFLFGHARLTLDGAPWLMATPRKTLQLLAYLVLHRDAAVARDYLSYLLYPDDEEESARAKMRATLYDLQRALPAVPERNWLVVDGTSVRWNPDAAVLLDVDEFEAALADAERLEEAVALYAGDLLEALYDEWIVAPRERLRSACIDALGRLVAQARRELDYPRAIGHAKRLLEMDPLREDVARRLIALRYEAGDGAGALREYERFERHVRDELGTEPMPETSSLRETIARGDPVEGEPEPHRTERSRVSVRAGLPFVGRDEEMTALLDGWSRAARGSGGIAFVGGEPGIGKSRLVTEFAREVDERGGRVLFGATGFPEAMPYQAIVQALRSALPLVASLRLERIWLAVLGTLLPELTARIVDLAPPPPIDPAQEQVRLFGALQRTLAALARPRPLLLLLEDLHWAEEATIAALTFLSARLALAPIFIVATYREDEAARHHALRRARHEAGVAGIARTLSVRPLSVSDIEDLARIMRAFEPESAAALHASSAGNPLLLGHLIEDREHRPAEGSTIRSLVAERLERLGDDARTVAEIAALVGQRFPRDVVRNVGGWPEAAFAKSLDELVDRRFVHEASGRGEFDYAFVHQVICETVAAGAAPQRAPDRHRRIARALEALHPERAAELAAEVGRHYELGADPEAAGHRYLAAARRAFSIAALDEAAAHLERALALTADPRLRADLLVERDRICRRTGNHQLRSATLDELAVLTEALPDEEFRREVALMRIKCATAASEVNRDEAGVRAALELLRELVDESVPRWRERLAVEEARVADMFGDFDATALFAKAALAWAEEDDNHAVEAEALIRLASLEVDRANIAAARRLLTRARAAAVSADDVAVELEALQLSCMVAYQETDGDGGIADAQRWLERAIQLGDRTAEARARSRVGQLLSRRKPSRAREEYGQALAVFEELGSRRGVAITLLNRGNLEGEIGNFRAAMRDLDAAHALFVAIDEPRGKISALACLAQLHAFIGDPPRARRDGEAALALARATKQGMQEVLTLCNLAIVAAAAGNLDEAIGLASEALALHRGSDSERWSGHLLRHLAEWTALRGDLRAARGIIDEMLAGPGDHGEWPQRFHWSAAQILHECGEHDLARPELERAHALFAQFASDLEGEDLDSYRRLAWNQAIASAYERDEWPKL